MSIRFINAPYLKNSKISRRTLKVKASNGFEITLNDSFYHNVKNIVLSGNSNQTQLSGKNKWGGFANDYSITAGDVDFTTKKDGTILANGTSTGGAYSLTSTNAVGQGIYKTLVTGTYTISGGTNNCRIQAIKTSGEQIASTNSSMTFTLSEDTDVFIRIVITSGVTVNNETVYPQLEIGSTATDYEEYCGGHTSPSLDYPQEIKSCGENINLFNEEIELGGYNSRGNKYSSNERIRSINLISLNAGTFTISCDGATAISIYKVSDESEIVQTGDKLIFTLLNAQSIKLTIQNTLLLDSKIKIENGSSVTGYTPYNMGSIKEKIVNKNLFDKNTIIKGKYIDANGNFVNDSNNFIGDFIKINKSLSYILSTPQNTTKRIAYYDNSKNFLSRELISRSSGTLTIPESSCYIRISGYNSDENVIQLEKSSVATNYQAHKEQNIVIPTQKPMQAIGNIRDTFVKENGIWYEKHSLAKLILDGTINYFSSKHSTLYTESSGFYRFILDGKAITSNGDINSGKSNYLQYLPGTAQSVYDKTCLWWEGNTNYNYASLPVTSLKDANDWLKERYSEENPLYIQYLLEIPEMLLCTQEQITALETMLKAKTYTGITHIYSEDEISPYIDLKYYAKI